MLAFMLTTTDNPYDPFDEFDNWYSYDIGLGHNTPSLLARVLVTSDSLSDEDQQLAVNEAVDRVLELGVNPLLKKVEREVLIE